jgi:hypothetical protein
VSPRRTLPIAALALLLGCAGPEPVLYPNPQLTRVGKSQAENDIAQCRQMADEAGAHRDPDRVTRAAATTGGGALIGGAAGAVGGAITGGPGIGAAIGAASGATAGLLSSLFAGPPVSQVHRAFVERCLRERGYEPMGWE